MSGSDGGVTVDTAPEVAFDSLTFGDADPSIANLEDVYLDGTLVLVGCGKDKRDPEDPTDVHVASVGPDENFGPDWDDETGPAWKARDLYTSSYFSVKREFAEVVSQWAGPDDGTTSSGWAILSAEHGVVQPWEDLKYYNKKVDDLGDDETNPEHRVRNPYCLRRPDGREIVTEMDAWAAKVGRTLMKWVAGHRDRRAHPGDNNADTLLVLAGQKYLDPLRERGVFEYGISRMTGNPNEGFKQPLRPRYLFENIDAGGNGEQMGWLSDAVDRIDADPDTGTMQAEAAEWAGDERSCERCGATAREDNLVDVDGEVVCPDCHPEECARCGEWTHENGLGSYPLCSDCQTERGGQKREPFNPDTTEQLDMTQSLATTDGGQGGE